MRNTDQHIGAGFQTFNNNDPDAIALLVNQKMGDF
jgi:hypothetical protein